MLFRQMKLLILCTHPKTQFLPHSAPLFKTFIFLRLSSPSLFGLVCCVPVCYFSVPNNLTLVSEVGSLCARSHSISCSIEWGKTHKHIDLTVGEWVALCT